MFDEEDIFAAYHRAVENDSSHPKHVIPRIIKIDGRTFIQSEVESKGRGFLLQLGEAPVQTECLPSSCRQSSRSKSRSVIGSMNAESPADSFRPVSQGLSRGAALIVSWWVNTGNE
jgi:hypothetical protein